MRALGFSTLATLTKLLTQKFVTFGVQILEKIVTIVPDPVAGPARFEERVRFDQFFVFFQKTA